MPHKLTVAASLPTGVEGLTFPNWLPTIAGQVVYLNDEDYSKVNQAWFNTSNSFGVAILTDQGEIPSTGIVTDLNYPSLVVAGTTAGTATAYITANGNYKRMFVTLNGYENTTATPQTISPSAAGFGGNGVTFTPTAGSNNVTASPAATYTLTAVSGSTTSTATAVAWNYATNLLYLPISQSGIISGTVVVDGV